MQEGKRKKREGVCTQFPLFCMGDHRSPVFAAVHNTSSTASVMFPVRETHWKRFAFPSPSSPTGEG